MLGEQFSKQITENSCYSSAPGAFSQELNSKWTCANSQALDENLAIVPIGSLCGPSVGE
jgi:hypothetical protein